MLYTHIYIYAYMSGPLTDLFGILFPIPSQNDVGRMMMIPPPSVGMATASSRGGDHVNHLLQLSLDALFKYNRSQV